MCSLEGQCKLRIENFSSLFSIRAAPMDDPWFTYRGRLCKLLEEYCNDRIRLPEESDFIPQEGRVYFVKVPTWSQIDKYMEYDKGEKEWRELKRLDPRTTKEDKFLAGKWLRGVMVGYCGKSTVKSECFEFRLIDVGRTVPIHKTNIRKAVLRFINIPAMSIESCLLLNNEEQIHEGLHQKWCNLPPSGTEIDVTAFRTHKKLTPVRMSLETENTFDDLYKEKFPNEYENTLKIQPKHPRQ